jgi:hypothetical protein
MTPDRTNANDRAALITITLMAEGRLTPAEGIASILARFVTDPTDLELIADMVSMNGCEPKVLQSELRDAVKKALNVTCPDYPPEGW